MADDTPIETDAIDTQALLARCMGNVSFSLAMLGEFEATGEQRVAEIAGHVAAGDCTSAAEAAHSLKGAAGILAAERLRARAAEIESLGKLGDLGRISILVDELRSEMTLCLTAACRYRQQSTAVNS